MHTTHMRMATYCALTTAIISGVSVFINKFAVSNISDPVLFAGLKNALVALGLLAILAVRKELRQIKTIPRTQKRRLIAIGLIGGSVPFALFFTGLALIPASHGALIHKTLFIWVAFLAMMVLRERFSAMQWLGVAGLFAANLLIGGLGTFSGSLGEWLVLSATLLWAVEHIIAKQTLRDVSPTIVAGARMAIGSLALLAFLIVTGRISGLMDLTLVGFGWTLVTATLLTGYVLTWYTALKHGPASYVAALLVPATLITNALSAIFITGTLSEQQVLVGTLLVLGTALVVLFARHVRPQSNLAPTT